MAFNELIIILAWAMPFILGGLFFLAHKRLKKIDTVVNESSESIHSNMKSWEKKLTKNSNDFKTMQQRIQHLETILTSELWDELQKKDNNTDLGYLIKEGAEELSDQKKIEIIAKKIR